MRLNSSYLLIFFLPLSGACGETISTPVPQPLPASPEPGLVRTSTPESETSALVAGLPGAVEGEGTVHLRAVEEGVDTTTSATSQGSFSALIAVTTPNLEARYEAPDGRLSEWVRLRWAPGDGEPLTLQPVDGPGPVSPPDARGLVVISDRDEQGTGLIAAPPAVEVVVANLESGAVASTLSDDSGGFRVELAAESGQTIGIFLSAAGDRPESSDFLTYPVP